MASELEQYLRKLKGDLSPAHPDQKFLRRILDATSAYIENTGPKVRREIEEGSVAEKLGEKVYGGFISLIPDESLVGDILDPECSPFLRRKDWKRFLSGLSPQERNIINSSFRSIRHHADFGQRVTDLKQLVATDDVSYAPNIGKGSRAFLKGAFPPRVDDVSRV